MNRDQARTLIAPLVIALAACGGLHAMVAAPLRADALDAEASLQAFIDENDLNAGMLENLPRVLATAQQTEDRTAQFTARNLPAQNESVMFSQILDLAAGCGVNVEQVSPRGETIQPAAESDAIKPRPGDRTVRCSLVGDGSYAATAEFLEMLQGEWAFCAVRECHITPDYTAGAEGAVRFRMTLELFGFDASPVVVVPGTEGTP